MTITIPNNNVDCDRQFGGPLTADSSRSSGEQYLIVGDGGKQEMSGDRWVWQ
jgi:hypothetical protein